MRDPMRWAVPLFRAFGISVRVHVLFFVITLGLFLRQVGQKDNPIWWFDVFAFTNALQGNLTAVYPAEVFPTELRSTGIGFSTAFSRIGAASGTFLLPVGISTIGIGPCMLIAAAICLIGGTVSQLMAPETTGLSLSRTAALRPAPA